MTDRMQLIQVIQTVLDHHEYEGNNFCSCGALWDDLGTTDGVSWWQENRHLAEVVVAALEALG